MVSAIIRIGLLLCATSIATAAFYAAGTHVINSPIYLNSGDTIYGEGDNTIIKPSPTFTGAALIIVANQISDSITIDNLRLEPGSAPTVRGIQLSSSNRVHIRRVSIAGSTSDGIYLWNSDQCRIADCSFQQNSSWAIFMNGDDSGYGGSEQDIVANSRFAANGNGLIGGHILISESDAVIIDGNTLTNNSGRALQLTNSLQSVVSNNVIESNAGGGLFIVDSGNTTINGNALIANGSTQGENLKALRCQALAITGNTFRTSWGHHLLLSSTSATTVSANTFSGCDKNNTASKRSIYLAGTSSANTVTGNTIVRKNSDANGIYLQSGSINNYIVAHIVIKDAGGGSNISNNATGNTIF